MNNGAPQTARFPRRKPLRRGFTLIEVIAVLVTLTAVSAMILSVLPRSNVTLATEADRLAAHLRHTQLQAQSDIYPWRLTFSGSTYQLGPVIDPGPGFTPKTIPGTGETEHTLAPDITVAGGPVEFDKWGRCVNEATVSLSDNTGVSISIAIKSATGFIP